MNELHSKFPAFNQELQDVIAYCRRERVAATDLLAIYEHSDQERFATDALKSHMVSALEERIAYVTDTLQHLCLLHTS